MSSVVTESVRVAVLNPEQDSVFMARRAKGYNQAGELEIFGGKIEHGESPLDAAVREVSEEFGNDIEFINQIAKTCEPYHFVGPDWKERRVRVHAFLAKALEPVKWILSDEHEDGSLTLVKPAEISTLPNVTRASKIAMNELVVLL